MKLLYYENKIPDNWDHFLYTAKSEAGLCQSTYWARVINEIDRASPIFLEVRDDKENKIIASLLLFHKIPWDRCRARRKIGIKELLLTKWRGWIEWHDGPVMFSDNLEEVKEALGKLFLWISEYAHKNRLLNITSAGFCVTSKWNYDNSIAALFATYGYRKRSWGTYLVDLRPNEEILWRKIDPSARKNIKKSKNLGLKLEKINSFDEFKNYYLIPYYKFKGFSDTVISNLLTALKVCWEEDVNAYYQYYVVKSLKNQILAALGMYIFNGVATEVLSYLSLWAFKNKIPAQDILHWRVLQEAKNSGCDIFDMGGVNPVPINSKEKGIRRFKEKWGGEYTQFYRFNKGLYFTHFFRR